MEPFYDRLTGLGYDIWIDKDGIESGDAFKKTILRAIKSSRCVVFFSSANSNASDWTAKEIGVAVKNRIPIIPVRIDGSDYNEEVQFDLVNLDYTDYSKTEERENQLEKFLRSIKNAGLYLEVFNILGINNVSSYIWVTDINNIRTAVPNYLTPRLINLKLAVEW